MMMAQGWPSCPRAGQPLINWHSTSFSKPWRGSLFRDGPRSPCRQCAACSGGSRLYATWKTTWAGHDLRPWNRQSRWAGLRVKEVRLADAPAPVPPDRLPPGQRRMTTMMMVMTMIIVVGLLGARRSAERVGRRRTPVLMTTWACGPLRPEVCFPWLTGGRRQLRRHLVGPTRRRRAPFRPSRKSEWIGVCKT